MQLDLFRDNQKTIRSNNARKALLSIEFHRALEEYAKIPKNGSADPEILKEREETETWKDLLQNFASRRPSVAEIEQLYRRLAGDLVPELRTGLIRFMIRELRNAKSAELIFSFPRFHLGCLLMEVEEYAEAAQCFDEALKKRIPARARFLAYRGDALIEMGETGAARDSYLAAFLEGPDAVDVVHLRDEALRDLIDGVEEGEAGEGVYLRHLPVWGWMKGIFVLDLQEIGEAPDAFAVAIQRKEEGGADPAPLWFDYLQYAEYLRRKKRHDPEMIRIRRKMKELNPDLFRVYLTRLGMSAR